MEREDREPIRVAALGHRQRPPIGRRHRLRPRRPSHDRIILPALFMVASSYTSGGHLRTLAHAAIRAVRRIIDVVRTPSIGLTPFAVSAALPLCLLAAPAWVPGAPGQKALRSAGFYSATR